MGELIRGRERAAAGQASYRAAIEAVLAAPVPMLVLAGAELRCLANAAARRLMPRGVDGVAFGEAAGRWASWPGFEADVAAVAAGSPVVVSERTIGVGADRIAAVLTVSALADPSAPGGFGGILVSVQDGSAEQAARAELVTSEERLRLGLEAGRMVTWEFNLTTGELNCSTNVAAIFGPGPRAEDFVARMPQEDAAADGTRLQQALADPAGIYQSEFRYQHPDGRLMHLQNWGKVMRDASGTPVRIHGVCMDITERKQAEMALQRLNETLEQEVEKRTEALMQAERALRQSQKVEALGHLTGGIAHDFNNLLGTLLGNFDLIARRPADAGRVRELAEAGLRAVERGAKLTSQLLTFSRTHPLELVPVRPGEIVEGMREMLQRTLGPLIDVELRIECGGRYVMSDPTQLEMAVLNLAINARDAMAAGGRLSIATAARAVAGDPALRDGEYVELTVTDNGGGMSAEVAARAFDPFFTTKRVGKGTGLGLSQVYGIARQAGGTARLRSAPGDGTTVRLLLPVTERRPSTAPDAPPPARAEPGRAITVLVVDDDADLRQVLAMALEDLGYAVLTAGSGEAGLEMISEQSPDVMIADFAMPGMTGAELAGAARRRRPELPIVLASGYAETPALDGLAGPPARLLRKPFRIDELRDVLAADFPSGS